MMDVNLIDGLLFGLLMMLLLGSVVIWGIPFQSRTKPDIDHSLTYTNTWLAPRQLVLQAGFSPDSVALWFLPASLMLIPMTFLLAISEFHLAWPIALGAGLLMACFPCCWSRFLCLVYWWSFPPCIKSTACFRNWAYLFNYANIDAP